MTSKLIRVREAAKFAAAIYNPLLFAAHAEESGMECDVINVDNHRAGVAWDDSRIFVAFCGTNDIKDVTTDLDADQKEFLTQHTSGAAIHSGVLKAILALQNPLCYLYKRIKEIPDGKADKAVYLTGHSLGGMIAAAFSALIPADGCITFGAARVGNQAFCNSIVTPTIRVVNSLDIVPLLPLKLMSVIFGRSRHHEDTLIYITGDGEITFESPSIWQIGEDMVRAIIKDACDADFIPAMIQYHLMDSYMEALDL